MAADASFAIEIAAQMGEGEQTIAELDAMVSSFTAAGKGASAFQQAIKEVGSRLGEARAAQVEANAALSSGREEYARLEASALQTAKAAEKAANSEAAISAKAATLAADALAAADAQRILSEQLASVNTALSTSTDYLPPELIARADALTVALGRAAEKSGTLEAAASAAAQAEQEAAARTLDAAAAALKAQDAADKYAADLLVLEKNAAAAAKEEDHLAQTFDNVKKLGAHADKVIAKQAESLSKLGGALGAVGGPLGSLGQKLTAPIKGFTELSGVMGESNAAALLATVGVAGLAVALAAVAGAAVIGLAKLSMWAVRLADKEGRLAAQTDRLESNFDDLFSGLNIDPVIEGMSVLADMFDKNTEAGQALKFLFESVFQPLIDQATNAAYVVEAFYLGFLIGATKLYIALKPAIKGITEFFGFEDTSLTDTLDMAKQAGELLAPVFLIVVATIGAAIAIFVAAAVAVGAFIAAIVAAPAIIGAAILAVYNYVVGLFGDAVAYIQGIDFVAIGASIMQGLADGIASAAGAVVGAITGAVSGAISAAKGLLGIASPSKVFADIGVNTGEGMAGGVEATTNEVQSAMTDMVSPDAALQEAEAAGSSTAIASPVNSSGAGSAASPANENASSGGGSGYNFAGAHFTFIGVRDAEHAAELFEEMLTKFEEGDADALGAGEAAA